MAVLGDDLFYLWKDMKNSIEPSMETVYKGPSIHPNPGAFIRISKKRLHDGDKLLRALVDVTVFFVDKIFLNSVNLSDHYSLSAYKGR